jgi:hypothetical protein
MDDSVRQPRQPMISISRETTFLEGPLRSDGYMDYLKATNDRLRQGISPETNAAIPLFQVLGPQEIKPELRERFFQWLEMPVPPEEGDYFLNLEDFDPRFKLPPLEQITEQGNDQFNQAYKEWDYVSTGPWKSEDFPHFAALLATNERSLNLFREGGKRTSLALPRFCTSRDSLRGAFSLGLFPCRDLCRQLGIHAMLRLQSGDVSMAWEDVLACYRWGRLCLQGLFYSDCLTGIAVEAVAPHALHAFAYYANLSAAQAQDYLSRLQDLPPRKPLREYWDYGERLETLDYLQELAVWGYEPPPEFQSPYLNQELCELIHKSVGRTESHQKSYRKLTNDPRLDWNEAMRCCNQWFDQVVAAYDLPDFGQRARVICDLEAQICERGRSVLQQISGEDADTLETDPQTLAHDLVELYLGTGNVSWKLALDLDTRSRTWDDFSHLSLALAGYRHDHGGYPWELEMLIPDYIQELPNDLYSGDPLQYQLDGDGFLLYAVGPNCRDDGGRHFTDEDSPQIPQTPEEYIVLPDDIAVHVPPKRSPNPRTCRPIDGN